MTETLSHREQFDEILRRIQGMAPDEKLALQDELEEYDKRDGMRFIPNPGPQTLAYYSKADELFYGGAAGGGKSTLVCGLAVNEHRFSHIFRREGVQTRGIIQEITDILNNTSGLSRAPPATWRIPDTNKVIEIAGIKDEADKENWQGRAADLKAFDEITHFTESQYRYIIGWNRSKDPNQRCRVIVTGNPPTSVEGLWVIYYWAAWLDPNHPNPAEPGELRWYTTIDGEDYECPNGDPVWNEKDQEWQTPRSRTFIPAFLEDNPDLMQTGYAAVLNAMPPHLRERMRRGKFTLTFDDDEHQVIPTEWVLAAQRRWSPHIPPHTPMTSIGVDIAQGGKDRTVLAPRYGQYFAELIEKPGEQTPDGITAAALILSHLRDGAQVNIDLGGGWGNSAYDHLKSNDFVDLYGIIPGGGTMGRDASGKLGFKNIRAEMWWRFREALDPSSPFKIALPPDQELLAELTAPKTVKNEGKLIQIEAKADIKARLARSPDKGDAVVQAWYTGDNRAGYSQQKLSKRRKYNTNLPTMANLGGRKLHGNRRRGASDSGIVDTAQNYRDEQGI